MRLLGLELKRLLKTKLVITVLLFAIIMSALMAYAPISFVTYSYLNENGQETKLKGMEAIKREREDQKAYEGVITPELAARALKQYQDCAGQYENGIYDEKMTSSKYQSELAPVMFVVSRLTEVYADPQTGMAPDPMELTEEDARNYYEQCRQHMIDLMNLEQKKHPETKAQAIAMYDKVDMPFSYYAGVDKNSLDYLVLLVFLMTVLGVIIAAPIFSIEYQTEADQILRCTKYGKVRLAVTKMVSCVLVLTVVYAICLTIFMVITNTAFGWDARQSDMQMVYSAISFLPLTIGGLQNITILAGFLSLMAAVLFTLFLSSKCKNAFSSSITALIFCFLPIFIYTAINGNIGNWLRCILPSGGVGLGNSFFYALCDTGFLYAGGKSVWVPYVILAAAVVDIIIFIGGTVYSYCRHRK